MGATLERPTVVMDVYCDGMVFAKDIAYLQRIRYILHHTRNCESQITKCVRCVNATDSSTMDAFVLHCFFPWDVQIRIKLDFGRFGEI